MNGRRFAPLPVTNFFSGLSTDVDLDNDDGLTEQRLEQWRPFSQNPFVHPGLGLTRQDERPQTLVVDAAPDDEKAIEKPDISRASSGLSQKDSVPNPARITHAGPTWVHLFYDLAWTATFASLTQNNTFSSAWDNLSYFAFFLVMWWMWASQTLYSVRFYTNDWVHLLSIFIQLVIFGLLAATTHGYDVTSYILKMKGADKKTIDDYDKPDEYLQDKLTSHSLYVIAFSFAVSRTLHWIQHVIVWFHAWRISGKRKLCVPLKLRVLPVGLLISISLFWATAGFTRAKGKAVIEAKLKFGLWGAGLLVELILHWIMESLDWERISIRRAKDSTTSPEVLPQSLKSSASQRDQVWPEPYSGVNLRERLEGITTVILGEGLNGIAGTLYAVLSAPGLGGPVATNVACTAIIIYFLAYFYFEGPTGHRDLKVRKRRQMAWLLLHFPFMISIILLLLGVKNQFILTSILSTGSRSFEGLNAVILTKDIDFQNPASDSNSALKTYLLERGLEWLKEFDSLNRSITNNGTIPLGEVDEDHATEAAYVWFNQIYLKFMVNLYESFMGGSEKIEPEMRSQIQEYYSNYTLAREDTIAHDKADSYHYIKILSKLLEGHILGARFIVGLSAIILISLGIMNRVHSKPRDRFQWGIILSRLAMGFVLLLLLLLNVGSYQTLWIVVGQEKRQAGVFQWVWAWWVLPTLTIAFAIEFVIEFMLLRCAGLAIARKRGHARGSLGGMFFRRQYGLLK